MAAQDNSTEASIWTVAGQWLCRETDPRMQQAHRWGRKLPNPWAHHPSWRITEAPFPTCSPSSPQSQGGRKADASVGCTVFPMEVYGSPNPQDLRM